MVSTKEHDEKKPKAIITKTSYGSVTLAFDHFAPGTYTTINQDRRMKLFFSFSLLLHLDKRKIKHLNYRILT